nr:hypothetical protein GCM10010200_049210 [Actinomadura rugatobispora]
MAEPSRERVGAGTLLGPPAAWALHDAEEAAMLPRWAHALVPERLWRQLESIGGVRFAVAAAGMGVLVPVGGRRRGHRTGGRSPAYQAGLHGVAHPAQATIVRGCGVETAVGAEMDLRGSPYSKGRDPLPRTAQASIPLRGPGFGGRPPRALGAEPARESPAER